MSHPKLIAAAQVNAFGGATPGIEFSSNYEFETATRNSAGVYVLELEHEHARHNLVVNVTRNNTLEGNIQASILDRGHIQINNFNAIDEGAGDSPFFITVWLND